MADLTKRLMILLLVMYSILGEIISTPSSFSGNEDLPSERQGCNGLRNQELEELKSRVISLESISSERAQQILIKEETIRSMEATLREKSDTIDLLQSEIDFIQSANLKSKSEEHIYEMEKQIHQLKHASEIQKKRRIELETRIEFAEKEVAELSSQLQNERLFKVEATVVSSYKKFIEMNWVWLSYKLGHHLNQAQAYLELQWCDHLRPTLNTIVHKASEKKNEVLRWSAPHIETLNSKWIPDIKDMWLTFTMYLKPKFISITNKSIEVYHTSKEALTPHIAQALDVSYNYIQVAKRHAEPYTSRVLLAAKPHLDRVHVASLPYIDIIRHGFTKLTNSVTVYHRKAQELLKNNDLTKPVATMDLAWFVASALLGLPLIFIIKLFSAISNTKQKRYNHKPQGINGHRRAKRRHPY